MNIHSNKLVLKAIFFLRPLVIFIVLLLDFFLLIISFVLAYSVLIPHDFKEGVWFQVQLIGELPVGVDFVIAEGVEVKYDSLQMHYQHIWSLGYQCSSTNINLLIAAIALVVIDNFSFYHLHQAGFHRLNVLHWEGQVVEVLNTVLNLATFLANHLTASLTTEHRLEQILSRGTSELVFHSIKDQVQEFLSILLLSQVGWVAIQVLECKAELVGVKL